jgi:hypothetical protein
MQEILRRVWGVLTLRAAIYREIMQDPAATRQAAIVVFTVPIVTTLVTELILHGFSITVALTILRTIALGFFGWLLGAWLLVFIANRFFHGAAGTIAMLRITGYLAVFGLFGLIPTDPPQPALDLPWKLISYLIFAFSVVAYVIAIREAAGLGTAKAFWTGCIAFATLITIIIFIFLVGYDISRFTAITLP